MNQTKEIADLEALLEEEIPCHRCKKPALLMSKGHKCRPPGWRGYLCFSCWKKWYDEMTAQLQRKGHVLHNVCLGACYTVEELSDYREF